MTENSLIQELHSRGHDNITVNDVVKNGVRLRGLTIRDDRNSNIAPCIYINDLLEEYDDASAAADFIENILASNSSIDLGCDVTELTNPDFIMKNVYVGLQKESDENLIKKVSVYDGLEMYLYIRQPDDASDIRWSVKLNPEMVKGIELNQLWESATKRTFAEFTISSMTDVLARLAVGDEIPFADGIPMYILSNKHNINGAACACDTQHIKDWAIEKGFQRLCVLPSSTHEMIIVPADEKDFNIDELSKMVKEVNDTQVRPQERLTDRAYLFKVAERKVS